jgi:hypothetical protein
VTIFNTSKYQELVRLHPQRFRNETMTLSVERGNDLSENFHRFKKHGQSCKSLFKSVFGMDEFCNRNEFCNKIFQTRFIAEPVVTKVWQMGIM